MQCVTPIYRFTYGLLALSDEKEAILWFYLSLRQLDQSRACCIWMRMRDVYF